MSMRQMSFIVLALFSFIIPTSGFAVSSELNPTHPLNKLHLIPSQAVYKTSFNCNKAGTSVEIAICHSKDLAQADIELSKLYYELLRGQDPDFANREKAWLIERDFCSKSIDITHCLLEKYNERIAKFKRLQDKSLAEKDVIESPKNVESEYPKKISHPVLAVLKKHNITLKKISYSKDGSCPTFHVTFDIYPLSTEADEHSEKVYSEILKANLSFPYAIVDEDNNFKVNVGFGDRDKTIKLIRSAPVSSPSTCLDGSSSPDAEKFTVIAKMKKEILASPFKVAYRMNGKLTTAYLYAIDEKIIPYEYNACNSGIKTRVKAKTGHYYIYLYDELTDNFHPTRTRVFRGEKPSIMGIEGADFRLVKARNYEEKDAIVVSQRDNCQNNDFESYIFWGNTSLQKVESAQYHESLPNFLQRKKN